MIKSFLITGGSGFIGANLAVALAKQKHKVTCFDNLSRRGSELLLKRISEYGCIFIHGDIRCQEDFNKLTQDYDVLIECSAEPSVLVGVRESYARYMINNNLVGAINCFEFARERRMPVLFFSTSRVYPYNRINGCRFEEGATRFEFEDHCNGISKKGIKTFFPLSGYRSLYGATKLSAEYILQEYCAHYGLNSIINRCGVIAGPWQLGKGDQGVFTYWLVQHYFKRPLRYIGFGGEGKQVRDLLHIEDLAALVMTQLNHIDNYSGEVFNVGGASFSNLSLCEATKFCREITGNRVKIESDECNRTADVIWFVTDNGEVERVFSWKPRKKARMIIEDTYSWLKANEGEFVNLFGR